MNCEYTELDITRARKLVSKPCKNVAHNGAFCLEHKQSAELLTLAEKCGYPRFEAVPNVWFIGQGKGSWKEYACKHPARYHADIMRRLNALFRQRSEDTGVLEQEAV